MKNFNRFLKEKNKKTECPKCEGAGCDHCDDKGYHIIDESFTKKQISSAIGIASDKRYAGNNMTGAVKVIEKIKNGLSNHPQVMAVLKRQNEELDEISASDKKHMAQIYDKKGNLTPLGKRVMDHGKKAADAKVADKARRKEYNAYQKSKRNEEVELDEASIQLVAKDLEAYAKKHGGMDKKDFMKAAAMMKSNQKADLVKFVDDLDTEPREKIIYMIFQMMGKKTAEKMFNVNINEAGPRHTMIPMNKRFGSSGRDSKKFDIYKKHMKKTSSDESTVRMIADNPADPESKRMMKNKDIAKGVELYKASFKEEVELDEKAPKIQGDSIAIQRARDKAHADAMGRHVKSGREKSAPSVQWKVQIGKRHYTVTARDTANAHAKARVMAKADQNFGVPGTIERI